MECIPQLIGVNEIMEMFRISRPTVTRWLKAGILPTPVTRRASGIPLKWRLSDVLAQIEKQYQLNKMGSEG